MPWRFWARNDSSPHDTPKSPLNHITPPPSLSPPLDDSTSFTPSQTILVSLLTTGTALGLLRLYKTRLRRIPTIAHLKPSNFNSPRTLHGYVTRVGDGDNFHFFHTPGGRLLGWRWLRSISKGRKLKGKTLHVRIAGIDAPEMAHFGRPEQPFAKEALEWLKGELLGKSVRVRLWRRDQYERVVGTVWKRRWVFLKTDVGEAMIRRGLATVYEAKVGSEFGGKEAVYRKAEEDAKKRGIGMWAKPGLLGKLMGRRESTESPREYKTRMTAKEKEAK